MALCADMFKAIAKDEPEAAALLESLLGLTIGGATPAFSHTIESWAGRKGIVRQHRGRDRVDSDLSIFDVPVCLVDYLSSAV